MKKIKFLRRLSERHIKLGKRRKKKQKWRRPRGRDNKMREKRKGYPAVVKIGYKKGKEQKKKVIYQVNSLGELEKMQKNQEIVLGRLGKKKKIEIAKKAKEKGIKILNLNIDEFLKNFSEKKTEEKPAEKNKNIKDNPENSSKETEKAKAEDKTNKSNKETGGKK